MLPKQAFLTTSTSGELHYPSEQTETTGRVSNPTNRVGIYLTSNLLFAAAIAVIDLAVDRVGHDPALFLISLCLLCSLPYVFATTMNGRHALLLITMPILFIFYGTNDILTYFYHYPNYWYGSEGNFFTMAEAAILIGIAMLVIGFSSASRLFQGSSTRWLVRDWRDRPMAIVGLLSIALGIWANWTLLLSAGSRTNLGKVDPIMAGLLVGGRMMEAVGAVLLTYAFLKSKSKILLTIIMAIGLLKIPMGFILDSKEIAISFLVIFVITKWLYDGGLPIRWVGFIATVIIVTFPIFYAYRTAIVGERHYSTSQAVQNASSSLDIAMKENAKTGEGSVSKGLQAFATRTDLKSLMELIVEKVGTEVHFQNGNTLASLPYVFIPRIIVPDKPNVPVGQLFNQSFHISSNPETFIATSFLGELYWNFGWPGVVIGMLLIGASLGTVSATCAINKTKTVTRLLILISAVYLLVFRFETGIAQQYTVFLRSVMIIAVLHIAFRNRPVRVT